MNNYACVSGNWRLSRKNQFTLYLPFFFHNNNIKNKLPIKPTFLWDTFSSFVCIKSHSLVVLVLFVHHFSSHMAKTWFTLLQLTGDCTRGAYLKRRLVVSNFTHSVKLNRGYYYFIIFVFVICSFPQLLVSVFLASYH